MISLFVVFMYPVFVLPLSTAEFAASSSPDHLSLIQVWSSVMERFSSSKNRGRKQKRQSRKNLLSRLRHPAAYFLHSSASGGESTPPEGESDEFEHMLRDKSDDSESDFGGGVSGPRQRMFRLRSSDSSNFPLV